MSITVLRLNHRIKRDKRVTTHLFLAARAFGADKGILSGEFDKTIIESINKTSKTWGGNFRVKYVKNWRSLIKSFKGVVVHLTMYGESVQEIIHKIRSRNDLLLVVGGAKVPSDLYELANFNVGVTNQPHSEISALSVFLDKFFDGDELIKEFSKAKKKIIPQSKGKKLLNL